MNGYIKINNKKEKIILEKNKITFTYFNSKDGYIGPYVKEEVYLKFFPSIPLEVL